MNFLNLPIHLINGLFGLFTLSDSEITNLYSLFIFCNLSFETRLELYGKFVLYSCILSSCCNHFYVSATIPYGYSIKQKIIHCKTPNICGIKFSRLTENDILAYFSFSVYNTIALESKGILMYLYHFLDFLFNYTLCHLLESPHGGDSNGMPQCINSWNGIKYLKYSPYSPFYLSLD